MSLIQKNSKNVSRTINSKKVEKTSPLVLTLVSLLIARSLVFGVPKRATNIILQGLSTLKKLLPRQEDTIYHINDNELWILLTITTLLGLLLTRLALVALLNRISVWLAPREVCISFPLCLLEDRGGQKLKSIEITHPIYRKDKLGRQIRVDSRLTRKD